MTSVQHGSMGMSSGTFAAMALAGLIALQTVAVLAMGHPAIYTCGAVKLWHGVVQSSENSQHLTDWYTYSHVIHGIGFYLLLWLIAPGLPLAKRFAISMALEAGWEVIENTPFVMERYRQGALAKGYFGDSAINSAADTLAAAFGFALARLMPVWANIVLILALELVALGVIRDNLTLNIIQLIFPNEWIGNWQVGGNSSH